MKITVLFISLFIIGTSNNIFSQPGILDCDFSADGKITIDINAHSDYGKDIAIQTDGKIVVAGTTYNGSSDDFLVIRYTTDGNLDTTFGNHGIDTLDFTGNMDDAMSIAIQQDGKIVVAGYSYDAFTNYSIAMARLNTDGSMDNTFGNNGKAFENYGLPDPVINSFVLQNDGKIVIGGGCDSDFLIARFRSNGIADSTYGINGFVTTDFNASFEFVRTLAIQSDGKIVAAGMSNNNGVNYDFALARYNTNGSLDNTFSADGKLTTAIGTGIDYLYDMVLQPDDKILAGGVAWNNGGYVFAVARYNTSGSLDLSFNSSGKCFTDYGTNNSLWALAVQQDGRILQGGNISSLTTHNDFALSRLNPNGTIDSTFGTNGMVKTDFYGESDRIFALMVQANGRIVAAGEVVNATTYEDLAVARYISGLNIGIMDFTKDANAMFIYPNPVNTESVIEYELLNDEFLYIDLFDMEGKLIKTFISGESRSKGKHKETLNFDEALPTGNYILSIKNISQTINLKIVKV
jgi:uncharacterized delta-60 repeat protein